MELERKTQKFRRDHITRGAMIPPMLRELSCELCKNKAQ